MDETIFQSELEELRNSNLYRRLRTLEPGPEGTWNLDGREVTLFCGNDYLGLSRHPRVVSAMQEAASVYGAGSGAARLISGTSGVHTKLEEKLAQFKLKEKALVFSAGYLANLGALTALAGPDDTIFLDKLCHASLIDGAKLSGAEIRVFPHKNYARLEELAMRPKSSGKKIIVSDSVFSMDGDIADISELVRIRNATKAFLILDDAHGTGVLGREGRGAYEDGGFAEGIDLITGTLSKALGSLGGFAAGSAVLIDYLVNRARPFIFATSLSPAVCASAAAALDVLRESPSLRERLWNNVRLAEEGLMREGLLEGPPAVSPVIPVMIGREEAALRFSEALLDEGFLVPAIRYPTVGRGKARLRVTVSAGHTTEQIRRFCGTMGLIKKGVISDTL